MKELYGGDQVYKSLAMDRTTFHLADTFALLQNDLKCREKLKTDRTNFEHSGYQLTYVPNEAIDEEGEQAENGEKMTNMEAVA